jgi:hypothetical protein
MVDISGTKCGDMMGKINELMTHSNNKNTGDLDAILN